MKTAKNLSVIFKALVSVASIAVITLFFFDFIKVGDFGISGFQAGFGAKITMAGEEATLYKSAWYAFAFILSAFTLVFSLVNFKKKGAKYASFGFSIAAFINMCVLYLADPITEYFDNRYALNGEHKLAVDTISTENFFLIAFIVSAVLVVLATVSMLLSDYVEVMESNGTKITIPKRIKRFFKDYKREIKNITWPTRQTVLKNFVVVIVMCVIVGAYIWLLDLGLGSLLKFLIGLKG